MSVTDQFKQPTQGGGAFIKLDQYEGQLILFRPESVDDVPNYKKPTETVKEVTALWVAFGPTGHDETPGAKFKGASLVRAANDAMKNRDFPWVLGVLAKVATKDTKDKYKIDYTPEAYAEVKAQWLRGGGEGEKPSHAWTLMPFTPKQAAQAGKYVEEYNAKANPFVNPTA